MNRAGDLRVGLGLYVTALHEHKVLHTGTLPRYLTLQAVIDLNTYAHYVESFPQFPWKPHKLVPVKNLNLPLASFHSIASMPRPKKTNSNPMGLTSSTSYL